MVFLGVSMIHNKTGNLLTAEVDALVNTVNCVGVMGKGIALQFKQAFPDNFKAYAAACKKKQVGLGKIFVYDNSDLIKPNFIVNFPTKDHWKNKSNLADIQTGLQSLVEWIIDNNITSIALPPLGAGLGGLSWNKVKLEIENAFKQCPNIDVWLYAPLGVPNAKNMPVKTTTPNMTVGRAALIELMARYQQQGYQHSLLEIQKLMYFMQAAGEPLRLKYTKHIYGPYAENLNHVLQRIEGHFIRGYGDRSSKAQSAQIELLPNAVEQANEFLELNPEAKERIENVAQLIKGFESPYGVELLSTVHWVAKNADIENTADVVTKVYQWNERKRHLMKTKHIEKAYNTLQQQAWI